MRAGRPSQTKARSSPSLSSLSSPLTSKVKKGTILLCLVFDHIHFSIYWNICTFFVGVQNEMENVYKNWKLKTEFRKVKINQMFLGMSTKSACSRRAAWNIIFMTHPTLTQRGQKTMFVCCSLLPVFIRS